MQNYSNIIKCVLIFFAAMSISCASSESMDDLKRNGLLGVINGEPVIPRNANKIAVPFFHNFTAEPSVAENLTLKVRRIIGMDGRLAVVTDNAGADLRLAGAVVQYRVQPVQYGNFNEPVRKRLRIVASIKLVDCRSGREIFYDSGIQAFQLFSEMIPPVTPEIKVQEDVLENLARRISAKVVEGWYTEFLTPAEKGKR
ncbi:MAG: LPS assembly lipoprotein LptE [Spirochaetes bacterium]|jgi:hypothetical protein|nr:LPS assembly lipoprotein LptE [Spirochaetota bacterium]